MPGPSKLADTPGGPTISARVVGLLGVLLVVSCAIVVSGRGVVAEITSLYAWELPAHPYLDLAHAGLLYVVMPLVVLSSLIVFLLPGILLVLALGKVARWPELLVWAFGTSLITYVFVTTGVKLLATWPVEPIAFVAAMAAAGACAWLILAVRVWRGSRLPWPLALRADVRRLLWTVAIPSVVLLALLPVIFWQDMNDDGLEALEIGRSLATHILPRFPTPTGFLGISEGMNAMAYPVHWFVALFGPVEASARLPFLLYLPVVFSLLLLLIEYRSPRALGLKEEALLCMALAIYVVTTSYNASYDPYFADIAAPTAFETMTTLCILATVYYLWKGAGFWFFVFALLSCLCRPTGLLVLVLLGISTVILSAQQRKTWLVRIVPAAALCVFALVTYEKVIIPAIGGRVQQAGFIASLARFQYLRFDDFSRINYILFPSGIVPVIMLLAIRRQDILARTLTLVILLYFVFFYLLAFVALHHFAPLMVLPLVVFWRMYLHHDALFRRASLPIVAVAAIVAFCLSLPKSFEINRTVRFIGQRIVLLVGDYDNNYSEQIRHLELYFDLLPPDWWVKDPKTELVSTPCAIIYYATRPKKPNTPIDYVIQPLADAVPPGFTKIADDQEVAIYVRDLEQWYRDRFRPLRTDYRSSLYDIPRSRLFRHWGRPTGDYSIDLLQLVPEPWRSRLVRLAVGG
jgi:hypothetical protein